MKAALWYAHPKLPNYSEGFRLGPYPTLEDGLREIREEVILKPGNVVEFGQLVPWVPDAGANCIIRSLHFEAGHVGEIADPWRATLLDVAARDNGAALAELNDALNLVLIGWLTRHEVHPNFGHIHNAQAYQWTGERFVRLGLYAHPLGSAPKHEEPDQQHELIARYGLCGTLSCILPAGHDGQHEYPPQCPHTGEDVTTAPGFRTRCVLLAGHTGPHIMEPVETPVTPEAAAAHFEAPGEPQKWERCSEWPPVEEIDNTRAQCELKAGHEGPHKWSIPDNKVGRRHQCRFVREATAELPRRRCNIFQHPGEDHPQHRFTCGKSLPAGEHSCDGDSCDLDEGHEGECRQTPF